MIEIGKVEPKKIYSDIIRRNETSFKALSDQMNAIIQQTTALEEHLGELEMAKSYRDSLRRKKLMRKLKAEEKSSEDRISSITDLSLLSSSPMPIENVSQKAIKNQLGERCTVNRKCRNSNPTLRTVLNVINDMRREVSELATRQNEMKFELEVLRGRLC